MKKSKVLIVIPRYNPTTKINYSYTFPLGLAYISSALKKAKYDVTCLNLNHYEGIIQDLMYKILNEKKYDFVCTGNLALGYLITKEIVNSARNHKSSPRIILGGSIITSEPELMFKSLNPDFAVVGEGEKTIVELLDCLEKNKKFDKVRGIIFAKDDKIIFTEKQELIENLDSLPLPDFKGFEFEKLLDNTPPYDNDQNSGFDYPRSYPIMGSRGCPFQCTFCYHSLGYKYRKRSIQNIMKEIKEAVKQYRINNILFYDDCFSIDPNRVFEFCHHMKKLIAKTPGGIKWGCQLIVSTVDKPLLTTLKNAGCTTVSFGFESFSPEVLKSMQKPITPRQIDQAYHYTKELKMGLQANFIFGDVAETTKTAYETLNHWKKNYGGQVRMGFIQPYPGSKIYEHCLQKGIIKDKLYFINNQMRNTWFNMTNSMSNKEITQLKRDILLASVKYDKFVTPLSSKKINHDKYAFKIKCPYCKKVIEYKNFNFNRKYFWFFMVSILCRNCGMRFNIVSYLRKLICNQHYLKLKLFINSFKKNYNN